MKLIDNGKRVRELKRDIARSEYDVDPRLVADAILVRLRLVKRGRQAMGGEAGRIRQAGGVDQRLPRH